MTKLNGINLLLLISSIDDECTFFYSHSVGVGVVPEEPEMLQLANGDIVESAPPIWGIDIKVWIVECKTFCLFSFHVFN